MESPFLHPSLFSPTANFVRRNILVDGVQGPATDPSVVLAGFRAAAAASFLRAQETLAAASDDPAFLSAMSLGRLLAWKQTHLELDPNPFVRILESWGCPSPHLDHVSAWADRETREIVLVTQPYDDDPPADREDLFAFCTENRLQLGASFSCSWWFPGRTVLLAFKIDRP